MYLNAEERKAELMKDNRVSDGMMFKLDWDPRIIGNNIVDDKQVTGIGEKLRSGSWDEWPQFFNILIGNMSLVGTRPPTVDEWEKYKYHHLLLTNDLAHRRKSDPIVGIRFVVRVWLQTDDSDLSAVWPVAPIDTSCDRSLILYI